MPRFAPNLTLMTTRPCSTWSTLWTGGTARMELPLPTRIQLSHRENERYWCLHRWL